MTHSLPTGYRALLRPALFLLVLVLAIHWIGERFNVRHLVKIHARTRRANGQLNTTSDTSIVSESPVSIPTFLYTNSTRCILYDRPPRTGSTTVYKFMDRCLSRRGYPSSLLYFKGVSHFQLIDHFLNNPSPNKSLISRHLPEFPSDSKQRIESTCDLVLYITSTRPMRERLLSKLKYETPLGDDRKGQTVSERRSVPTDMFHQLVNSTLNDDSESLQIAEIYYEHYPGNGEVPFLTPDYVIRSDTFVADFTFLLRALQCPTKFISINVHKVKSLDQDEHNDIMHQIPVTMSDARHKVLLKYSRSNYLGLRKARLF